MDGMFSERSRTAVGFGPQRGLRVLVCGGGIAGNTAGLQLLRAGIRTTIVERAPSPRPGGQAVDLRGPARVVAERMGLMPGIRKRQLDERGMIFVDGAGREYNRMPADLFGGEGIVAEIEISRGDLNAVLLEAITATNGDLEYRYGEWITEAVQHSGGVDVVLSSGESGRFDVVIGADGLHSSLRPMVFGPDDQFLTYLGGYMSFFTLSTPASKAGMSEWFVVHQLRGGSFVGIRSDPDPATSKAVVILRGPASSELYGNPERQKDFIRERLANGGWETPAVLKAMTDSTDFYFDELARVEMPTWVSGRIVLLGDAAFCGSPLTGQGTSLAMVAAYVLSGELAEAETPTEALSRFERLLRPLVAKGQELMPGGIRLLTPGGRFEMMMSRLVNRLATSRPMRPLMTRLVSGTVDYQVPEYRAGVNTQNGRDGPEVSLKS